MLLDAAEKWHIDLSQSYMIGDTEADTKAAIAAECKSILIEAPYNKNIESNYKAKNLLDAALYIQSEYPI